MPILPYQPAHEPAVARFNQRLAAGGSPFRFPAASAIPWLPRRPGATTYLEGFVSLAGDEVHGGYLVKRQPFLLRGEPRDDVANLQLPLSEGSVDPAHARVGVEVLVHAVRHQPRMYALGMGGTRAPLPTALRSLGWSVALVPFHFRVVKAGAFLRHIRVLRTSAARRRLFDAVAASGLATPALALVHGLRSRRRPAYTARTVEAFGDWADAVWQRAQGHYDLLARRDAAELDALYPPGSPKPIRLAVSRDGEVVGWALLFDSQLEGHKQFGNMRLGTLVDCLAVPGSEEHVARAAFEHLRGRGVDLVVSNQSHAAWCDALRRAGFLRGPSNYALALSRGLQAALDGSDLAGGRLHVTRGDGDGPIHL